MRSTLKLIRAQSLWTARQPMRRRISACSLSRKVEKHIHVCLHQREHNSRSDALFPLNRCWRCLLQQEAVHCQPGTSERLRASIRTLVKPLNCAVGHNRLHSAHSSPRRTVSACGEIHGRIFFVFCCSFFSSVAGTTVLVTVLECVFLVLGDLLCC